MNKYDIYFTRLLLLLLLNSTSVNILRRCSTWISLMYACICVICVCSSFRRNCAWHREERHTTQPKRHRNSAQSPTKQQNKYIAHIYIYTQTHTGGVRWYFASSRNAKYIKKEKKNNKTCIYSANDRGLSNRGRGLHRVTLDCRCCCVGRAASTWKQ